ncbi:MAG: Crp/Fnr family transcriptional regulator, partial [Bacteroidota bacterium]
IEIRSLAMIEEKFLNYFSRFIPLSEEEKAGIRKSLIIKEVPKGSFLLKAGEITINTYFVLQGCVRQYYLLDGEEKTSHFFTENQWLIALDDATQKSPVNFYWSCLEDSILVVGNEAEAIDLYKKFPRFEMISRKILEADLKKQQEILASFITSTPEQRYLKLMEEQAELIQRVPQYHLASYIGVKPESLSRIRKRILSKK